MTDRGPRKGLVQSRLIEARPIRVEGRELVPLVRVTSRVQRKASLCGDRVSGQGYGFVDMRPVTILDKGENGQRVAGRHPFRNETARLMGWLALIAFFTPFLATLLAHLSRRLDHGSWNRRSA